MQTRECANCGEEFSDASKTRRYCSIKCRSNAENRRAALRALEETGPEEFPTGEPRKPHPWRSLMSFETPPLDRLMARR